MAFDRNKSAGYVANHLARLFALALQQRIKPLGIVPGQFPALIVLWESDGLTQKDITARLDIEQATMANTLSRMERDGLIRRTPHPTDARAQQIWLTQSAKSLRDAAYAAAHETNEMALAGLSQLERRQFVDTMLKVIGTLQHDDEGSVAR